MHLSPVSTFRTAPQAVPTLRSLQIGFLCPHNARDRRAFSGTAYQAARALAGREGLSLRLIGAHHRTPGPLDRLRRTKPGPAPIIGLGEFDGLDAVVGLVATGLLDRLDGLVPYLHVTDATPGFLRDHYGWHVPASADAAEMRVAALAMATVYSAGVMAERAEREFGRVGEIAEPVPFGVNLDDLPAQPPEKQSLNQLNLLFVGLDWERKGGDMAIATLDRLLAAGLSATLTVVGKVPGAVARHPAVRRLGYLDKNRRRDRERLARAYAAAHLLLLPTKGDCTPMVVAEAMRYGTPVVATDTGGIAEMVGQAAGRVLPLSATAEDWAEAVRGLTGSAEAYAMASDAAFDRATSRYDWAAWAAGIDRILRARLDRRAPRAA